MGIDLIHPTPLHPYTRVGSCNSSSNYEYYSVVLQHFMEVHVGTYNITIISPPNMLLTL